MSETAEVAFTQDALIEGINAMFEVAPVNWWRFVPCSTCNSRRHDVCRQGGDSWPTPAHRPHASRIASARLLHGTLWLLANGHAADVLTPQEVSS